MNLRQFVIVLLFSAVLIHFQPMFHLRSNQVVGFY